MSTFFSDNALFTLKKRYLHTDANGNCETPEELLHRVANAVASVESADKQEMYAGIFYDLMARKDFLPNSPTLMNAGLPHGQLAACFVLPVGDSMEEIFDAVKNAAIIHKSGGGTGFSFSRLRPAGDYVGSTGGVASGPLSFIKIFNTATEQVKQGGKRRGANMGMLRVDHPDILAFIKAKEVEGEFNNFNFSVAVTDKFMEALASDGEYRLTNPRSPALVVGSLRAREVFDLLVEKAWLNGEPGVIFIDRINAKAPTPGEIEATNPCGEQPLLPYEACNLGSLNLANFADDKGFHFDKLRPAVSFAVRFLDDIIDLSEYPIPRIAANTRQTRKIGLGVMGFADALFKLNVPYNSNEALDLASKIMGFIREEAEAESCKLAEEKGPFPAWEQSVFFRDGLPPRRNATLTTIAPTGTLSILADCSSGIEPIFALAFTRHILAGSELVEFNPVLKEELKRLQLDKPEIVEAIVKNGNLKDVPLPDQMKKIFVTASEIAPSWHLLMQAAFQKFTDNAVSKTVNLPNEATRKDVEDIYMLAYRNGCKGVTVYRDGSRTDQPMKKETTKTPGGGVVLERPDILSGYTQKIQTGLGTMYLTINELDGKPFEVFATIGKSGRSTMAKAEAVGRLVSLALRSGVDVQQVVEQIRGIGGEHPVFHGKGGMLLSIPDAIARALESRYLCKKEENAPAEGEPFTELQCPECGGKLIFHEGCVICKNCSWSKCG